MARPKKSLIELEFHLTYSYIQRGLTMETLEIKTNDEINGLNEARKELSLLTLGKNEAAFLADWCDKYLTDKARSKMLTAIRVKRHRMQTEPKSVVLSGYTHADLLTVKEKTKSESLDETVKKILDSQVILRDLIEALEEKEIPLPEYVRLRCNQFMKEFF